MNTNKKSKNFDKELDKKVSEFIHFRITYQELYKNEEMRGMACLGMPKQEEIEFVKIILGWLFSNLAWDFLKKVLSEAKSNLFDSIKDEKERDRFIESYLKKIKEGFKDLSKLDKSLQNKLIEERAVHYLLEKGNDLNIMEAETQTKKLSFEQRLLASFVRVKPFLNIKFSSKEKVKLKKLFFSKLNNDEESKT